MNRAWGHLDIEDVPVDLFKPGAWEIEWRGYGSKEWQRIDNCEVIAICRYANGQYRIRRPEGYVFPSGGLPEAPTHEEIMTKWWEVSDGKWLRVFAVREMNYREYRMNGEGWETASWFTGRKSAEIPPA